LNARTIRLIGLHVHAIRPAGHVEVVDVDRSEIHLHRVVDVGHVHAEALRLVAIDIDVDHGRLLVNSV